MQFQPQAPWQQQPIMLLAIAIPLAPLLQLLVRDILELNELLKHTTPAKSQNYTELHDFCQFKLQWA